VRPIPGQTRWRIESAVLVWLATVVVAVVIVGVVSSVVSPWERPLEPWQLVVSAAALWLPALAGLYWVSRREGTARFVRDYRLTFRISEVLVGVPLGVLTQLVLLEALYWPLNRFWPQTFSQERLEEPAREVVDSASGMWTLAIIVVVAIGAPLVEELLYRGLIFGALEGRLTTGLAVAISGVWFGAAHFEGIQTPGLIVVGLVLGICAAKTKRLGLAVVTHAAFNATALVMLMS
jgi:uncharacterized protein